MAGFNGLIQHSFALRLDGAHRRSRGAAGSGQFEAGFTLPATGGPEFRLEPVGKCAKGDVLARVASHSPLVRHDLTGVKPIRARFLEREPDGKYGKPLPSAFSWAAGNGGARRTERPFEEARFVFSGRRDASGKGRQNDFLVAGQGCDAADEPIAAELLQLIAHRRSRLFGLALANRLANVMLPHATLTPVGGGDCCSADAGPLLLQPLVTTIRDGREGARLGRMFALTLFLVPVDECRYGARTMSVTEIKSTVNAGWGLATAPPDSALPSFDVGGPLGGYLSRLAPTEDLAGLLAPPSAEGSRERSGGRCPPTTLRQATEALAFCVALAVNQGQGAAADEPTVRRIGDDVVTALGAARVSSVTVVDPELTKDGVQAPGHQPPGSLSELMKELAGEARPPRSWTQVEQRKYRLDRAFVDADTYAVGVLPHNRCLIVASAVDGQDGRVESGLMQAASLAYMTLGAATAIGVMRAIDRELERVRDENPTEIAEIDREIAANLHEIYDFDITREAYRRLYRRLLRRLGVTGDYETLQDKMETLYRATSTKYRTETDRKINRLTLLLLVLGVFAILVALAELSFK